MTDGKMRQHFLEFVCWTGEIPLSHVPLACCRTGCTYIYTNIKPCTGFKAQTPKPICLVSAEKRGCNFPCRLQESWRYRRGMTGTRTGSTEVAELQTFPLGYKEPFRWSQPPTKPLPGTRTSWSELPKGTQTTSSTVGAAGGGSQAKRSTQLPPERLPLLPWEGGIDRPEPMGKPFQGVQPGYKYPLHFSTINLFAALSSWIN